MSGEKKIAQRTYKKEEKYERAKPDTKVHVSVGIHRGYLCVRCEKRQLTSEPVTKVLSKQSIEGERN